MSPFEFLAVVVLVGVPLYFLPAIIAYRRHHRNKLPILALNICAGWTFIGWLGALIWSLLNHDTGARA
ncbi:MAG: hypothetical protein DI554_00325 [Sphingobium sp.]|nr:MAG: hypothetical protein DI554_00325 [Sphingobium sp.]